MPDALVLSVAVSRGSEAAAPHRETGARAFRISLSRVSPSLDPHVAISNPGPPQAGLCLWGGSNLEPRTPQGRLRLREKCHQNRPAVCPLIACRAVPFPRIEQAGIRLVRSPASRRSAPLIKEFACPGMRSPPGREPQRALPPALERIQMEYHDLLGYLQKICPLNARVPVPPTPCHSP